MDLPIAALTRTAVFCPVLLICVFVALRLLPRLTPTARHLAIALLLTWLLVLLRALSIQPSSPYETQLWELRNEWNIPSTVASTQLAVLGAISLLAGWLAGLRHRGQSVYLFGFGLLFLFLAWDEYFVVHENIANWDLKYAALGLVVASATLALAWRADKSLRLWWLTILAGLAISASGAILLDSFTYTCETIPSLPSEICRNLYVWEETLEFLGVWLILVAALGIYCAHPPPPTHTRAFRRQAAIYAIPALWLLFLAAVIFSPRIALPVLAQPVTVQFKSDIELLGMSVPKQLDQNSTVLRLQLYTGAQQEDYFWLGYSLHLVEAQDGQSLAQVDIWADRHHSAWILGPEHTSVFLHDFTLPLPAQLEPNRAFYIVLSMWRACSNSQFCMQPVLSSSQPLLSDTQVILGEIALQAPASSGDPPPALARFDNGFALQPVTLPASASAGTNLPITFRWRADSASNEDYGQFLHMQHIESGEWVVYDQPPLGARLPTRLWYSGLSDSETWQLPLPAELAPGGYAISTGLYRNSDKERLPARDTQGAPFTDARISLGTMRVEG